MAVTLRNLRRITLVALAIFLTACNGSATPAPVAMPAAAQAAGASIIEGRLVPRQYAALGFSSAAGGVVDAVLVEQGQHVEAGDALMRLRGPEFDAALAQAQAGLAVAEARLVQAKAPATPEQIAAAEARLRSAQALAAQAAAQRDAVVAGARKDDLTIAEEQVVQAEAQLHYAEAIHDATIGKPFGGPAEWQARLQRDAAAAALEIARAQLNLVKLGATNNERRAAGSGAEAAEAQVALAQADLDQLNAGARAEDLAVLEAGVDQARAAVEQAQAAVDNLTLRAPFAGTVAEVAFDPGERVNAGQVAVTLADDTGWLVETKDLTELDVVKVKEGQRVIFTLDALPGVTLSGTVTSIARVYVEKQGDVTYLVKIAVDEKSPEMRWGMTAAVTLGP